MKPISRQSQSTRVGSLLIVLGLLVVTLLSTLTDAAAPSRQQRLPLANPQNMRPPIGDLQIEGSNIEQARVLARPADLETAAGHHHHHKHSVHGWLKMGAHSGHKGAFGWHAKYPVGGKGRR